MLCLNSPVNIHLEVCSTSYLNGHRSPYISGRNKSPPNCKLGLVGVPLVPSIGSQAGNN